MNDVTTVATNSFVSWVREGVAGTLSSGDPAAIPRRAALTVGVSINGADLSGVPLQLYGPGDVIGIDPRLVVRTTPRHASTDFEPNHFPAIEFLNPAFPWLFTPIAPSDQKLLPWICLIVVRKQDGVSFEEPDVAQPLPVLRIDSPAQPAEELPPLEEAWAWAHGHVSWARDPQAGPDVHQRLAELFRDNRQQTISRLICPRRLQAGAQYHACVAPVFDLGIKAGLGLATADDDSAGTLQLAWRSNAPPALPVRLPVYYRWEFTAGAAGDFESLVRRIVGRSQLPGVGQRPMDVSHAGPAALDMPGVTLGLEGALQPRGMNQTPWDATARDRFEHALTAMLNAPATAGSSGAPPGGPILAPPLYGRAQTGQRTVPLAQAGEAYPWLRTLNLDPRYRAAAAFGTAIVQQDQEQLMASAWAQLADVRQLNRLLQQAQLGREIGAVMHRKRLSALVPAAVVAVARPALTRIGTSDPSASGRQIASVTARTSATGASFQTFQAWIADSAITAGAVSSAFQAIARTGGPMARRLFTPAQPVRSEVVRQLNVKRIVAAPPRSEPAGTIVLDKVPKDLGDADQKTYENVRLDKASRSELAQSRDGWADDWKYHIQPAPRQPQPQSIAPSALGAPPRQRNGEPEWEPKPPTVPPRSERGTLNDDFRAAAIEHQNYLLAGRGLAQGGAAKASRDLDAVKAQVLVSLDPERTMVRRAGAHATDAPSQLWDRADPLDPVLAAPRFPQPMWEPLRQLAQELILPGAEQVPPDTIAPLEPNHSFIEAYLVGLNQEMTNELLWRGYPGDLSATYFRHFWDTAGALPRAAPAPDRAEGEDFKAIKDWHGAALGGNAYGASAESRLVLLLRSEVLRRYPSTTIYAVKAVRSGSQRGPGTEEHYPLFRGTVEPDITFFGFALTEAEARGSDANDDLGYYFVIQQHPAAPVFGLAAAKSAGVIQHWSELSWDDLAGPAPGGQPTHVRVTASVPTPAYRDGFTWGQNAAHMAAITLRSPVRIARHASLILPTQS